MGNEAQVPSSAPLLTTWIALGSHLTSLGVGFFSLKMSCSSRFDSVHYITEYLLCSRHGVRVLPGISSQYFI